MFTGIVQAKGEVTALKTANELSRINVSIPSEYGQKIELGASIANNGVCLTVVEFQEQGDKTNIAFDVIDETLRVTNLASIKVGSKLNIERSLKAGDELGGHLVSGHVHCQAEVGDIAKTTENCAITFNCQSEWMKYILPKGFVAINGVSLTLGEVSGNTFKVHLIPETLSRTNIGDLMVGDKVNIEIDQQTMTIVETIERLNLVKSNS